jgi:hypothetical protein
MVQKKGIQEVKPPILFSETQKIIKEVESLLQGDLICYWNSQNGSICHNDIIGFHEIFQKLSLGETIYLFIKSAGGDGRASLRIVNLIRRYVKKVITLIPLECSSAATMLALGSDEIHMGPLAYLSAVDTSITHKLSPVDKNNFSVSVSQDELSRVIRLWNAEKKDQGGNPYEALYQYIHPLVIGAVDRASSLSIMLCKEILSYHMEDEQKAEEISNQLNSNYPSHSYPITYIESKKIGLNAKPLDTKISDLLVDLNELYSEMGQRAYTDYDDLNYHDNEILNILEGKNIQFYYQVDRDWHYRTEERRWVSLNDKSSWRKIEEVNGRMVQSMHHIR